MKKFKLYLSAIMVIALFASFLTEGMAQSVKITRIAMSPRLLGTYTGFPVSTGLRTVPIGMKVYLRADTTGAVTTFSWTVDTKPAGSSVAFSDASIMSPTLVPDLAGTYIISVTVDGGKQASDTLFASTFAGMPASGVSCGTCHGTIKAKWEKTRHASLYQRGVTGQAEVADVNGKFVGQYGQSCIKCHTTGWEPSVDNGNFGYETKKVGFDTTWYAGLDIISAGRYYVPYKLTTIWDNLTTNYPDAAKVASISCESCHGPGQDHMNGGAKSMISKSVAGGVCGPCHDAPNSHVIGKWWDESHHSKLTLSASAASRSGCWPCHNGEAYVAFNKNKTTPDYSKVNTYTPMVSISCATCHDPHSDENHYQLRALTMLPLLNGYVPPKPTGGSGQLCMNCHRSRYDAVAKVEAQARVFGDRFYPHYSPQADMFLGANAYEYGLPITGLGTHQGLEEGCVTCHMALRKKTPTSTAYLPNHQMGMKDANGKDIVTACIECHGEIEEFDDIVAMDDFDGNGQIEGVLTEIQNMLDNLKNLLPKNAANEVVSMRVDSALVQNHELYKKNALNLLGAIWNYWFIKNDLSKGVHNTKYTLALLKATFSALAGQVSVSPLDQNFPKTFELTQNYPNPFNPSTNLRFSIPQSANVQLNVYNMSGQLVTTLTDGYLTPGNYSAKWDAVNVGSGMYIYKLTAVANGKLLYSTAKKMVLTK